MDRRKFIKNAGIATIPIIAGSMVSCESVTDSAGNTNWTADFNIMKEIGLTEAIMVNTYQAAIDSILTTQTFIDTATLFKNHHLSHFNAYNDTLISKDWAPLSLGTDIEPRYNSSGDETETMRLFTQLEFEAAQFYYSNIVENVTTDKVRMLFTNILPMEMGHVVSLKSALGLTDPNGLGGLFEDFTSGL